MFRGWEHHQVGVLTKFSYEGCHTLPIENKLVTGERSYLAQQLQDHSLLAVSDRSYIQSKGVGTAAWIIETTVQLASTEGTLVTSSEASVQNSY